MDQKKIIVNLNSDNFSQHRSAQVLNVSQSCVSKFLKRWRCRGNVANLRRSGRPGKQMIEAIDALYSSFKMQQKANIK